MNYLFTAAGRGSRFRTKGLKPPKPLLKVFGNELLIWSMNSFKYSNEDNIYTARVKAKDNNKEQSFQIINVFIQDVNDNNPVISNEFSKLS